MLNRNIAPAAHEIQGMELIAPEVHLLKNGLRVFVFHSEGQEHIKADFVFKNLYSEDENSIAVSAMNTMLKEGTHKYTGAQIADLIDYFGAYLIPEFSYDYSSLTLYTLNKNVSSVLPIVWDVLNAATFPQEEFNTYIGNTKQSLQIALENNEYVAKQMHFQSIFPESRYGNVLCKQKLEALTQNQLIDIYKKVISPNNCSLFLSGKITKEILEEIFDLFGQPWLDKHKHCEDNHPIILPNTEESIFENRPASLQSAIRIGKKTISRAHSDFPALQFTSILLGGYFGSRLMQNIREDKGYTYGVSSSLFSFRYSGVWALSTQVGVDVTDAALVEIMKEINTLQQYLASDKEIDLVRNYILGSLLGSLESIFSHTDKFKSAYFFGLDLQYYNYYTQVCKSITSETIRHMAQKYLCDDDIVQVVVGRKQST